MPERRGGQPRAHARRCQSRLPIASVNAAQPATGTVAGNWQLQMGTGSYRSTCMVTHIGHVISIGPG